MVLLAVIPALPAVGQLDRTRKSLPGVFEDEILDDERKPTLDMRDIELIPLEGAIDREKYLLGPGD